MIEISVNADVRCADGHCGRSTHVVINPHTQQVTHLVVKARGLPHAECLVPVRSVEKTAPDLIRLSCTREDLTGYMPFTKIEWRPTGPVRDTALLDHFLKQMSLTQPYSHPVKCKLVPPGELPLGRNTRVETTNGHVGRVQKLLIYPTDGRIMRLVIRTGRFWNQKEVIVPFWRIARFGLDMPVVETQSTVPVGL